MKVLVIDTEKTKPDIVDTPGGLDEWCRLLNCSVIDIATRTIAGKPYDLIIDDEGLFKGGAKVTALDSKGKPQLVGNLVICNFNEETGEEAPLSDSDILHILKNVVILTEDTKGEDRQPQMWLAVSNVDFIG